jgi:nucleoside 2-deoxyribosyltransferase
MNYNLTENQKELCRWIVKTIRGGEIDETFNGYGSHGSLDIRAQDGAPIESQAPGNYATLHCLAMEDVLSVLGNASSFTCTVRGKIYKAVDSDFAEEDAVTPVSTLAQPHPPEIAMSLDRLRAKYPDPKKLGFLVMRFTAAKPFAKIVEIIKQIGEEHGLKIIRADENEFHADLWGNVRTHLHGCGFGIAVYERIETNEPNANVGLEVGYLMAMNKPVLLLKDKTVETLPADLAGKLYKPFDPHDPEGTIPAQFTKWLEDYGIVVPKHP